MCLRGKFKIIVSVVLVVIKFNVCVCFLVGVIWIVRDVVID